jgi:hypothetical protein
VALNGLEGQILFGLDQGFSNNPTTIFSKIVAVGISGTKPYFNIDSSILYTYKVNLMPFFSFVALKPVIVGRSEIQ